ncbi:MAG: PLP-dependent aspartate aminotransferase family protein [Bacteroidota bacterium]
MENYQPQTQCVHSGTHKDPNSKGIVTPVYPATSHGYLDTEVKAYPRYFNTVNQDVVVRKVAALEKAADGLVFASGMAAISTSLFAHLKAGDHIVFQKRLYGGTSHLIRDSFGDYGIEYSFADGDRIEDYEVALKANTRMIYIESPSNPLLGITDIADIAQLARKRGILTMIDNTFASPINQNPIPLGIDLVMHSATKYLGGHSDICAGMVLGARDVINPIRALAKKFGGSLNAETCALLERSIKTLALRVRQQNQNAAQVADFLNTQSWVRQVNYPGLKNHPNHEIARQQMPGGFGGMLSFELESGIDPISFQKNLELISSSMSLGGVETTICSPFLTSHAALSPAQRVAEGIDDQLLRVSVGIEEAGDLIKDFEQAVQKPKMALV